MIEVEIENFQSIEKTSLQIEGFTALVGRSNIGKSAIARAIKYALTGALGTEFVRHGPRCERRLRKAKKCRCKTTVTIRTSDITVVWEKGDEDNSYKVTRSGVTREYSALDRGEPEFLKPEFQQVEIGDSKELLQVTEQFEPIFLLNKTGGVVADVLSDVAQLDDVNEAITLVNKDRKNAVSTRTVREKDVVELGKAVRAYSGLDDVLRDIAAIETGFAQAAELRVAIAQVQKYLDTLGRLTGEASRLIEATGFDLPDIVEFEQAGQAYFELQRFYSAFCERAPIVKRLSGIDKVELPAPLEVGDVLTQSAQIEGWLRRLVVVKNTLVKYQGVDKVELPAPLEVGDTLTQLVQIEGWLRRLAVVGNTTVKYQGLDKVPDLSTTEMTDALAQVAAVARFERQLSVATAQATKLSEQIAETEEAEADLLQQFDELGVCPTCTQGIAPGHLHLKAS